MNIKNALEKNREILKPKVRLSSQKCQRMYLIWVLVKPWKVKICRVVVVVNLDDAVID